MTMLMGGNPTQTYATLEEGNTPSPGAVFHTIDGKAYKFVRYTIGGDSTAAVVGNAAYYVAATGYSASQVTSDLSSSDQVGAGILVSAPADNEYCWIQIKGPATMAQPLAGGADGDPLTAAGAGVDGRLDVSAAVTDVICAIAEDISERKIICNFPW